MAVVASVVITLKRNKSILNRQEEISEQSIKEIPVKTDTVKSQLITHSFSFTGILNPVNQLTVMSQAQGKVIKISAGLGDFVHKGSLIIKVDDVILKANQMVAEASYEKAKKDLDRFKNMIEKDGVTRDQLEKIILNFKNAESNLITINKRLEDTSIEAPFSGYINHMYTKEGGLLGSGAPAFEIVDISAFKITLNVSEDEIAHLQKGMTAYVRPKSVDSIMMKGKITHMSLSADIAQQFPVEIVVNNPATDILKGGMIANISLQTVSKGPVIAVARDNIQKQDKENFVYKIENGIAHKTLVRTGDGNDELVEVTSGLKPGDLVASSGFNELRDGMKINPVQ